MQERLTILEELGSKERLVLIPLKEIRLQQQLAHD